MGDSLRSSVRGRYAPCPRSGVRSPDCRCAAKTKKGRYLKGNDRHSQAYGTLVGQIHQCLDERPDDPRRFHLDLAHLIDEPLAQIEPFLEHRPRDFDFLRKTGNMPLP